MDHPPKNTINKPWKKQNISFEKIYIRKLSSEIQTRLNLLVWQYYTIRPQILCFFYDQTLSRLLWGKLFLKLATSLMESGDVKISRRKCDVVSAWSWPVVSNRKTIRHYSPETAWETFLLFTYTFMIFIIDRQSETDIDVWCVTCWDSKK